MQSSPQRKIAHIEPSSPASPSSLPSTTTASEVIKCILPPHRTPCSFSSFGDYEVHYQQFHVNRCGECGKNFPTELFLNLHIEENHDPLMDERRKRGEKTFGCFVEGCEKRCSTPQKRRLHLIDKHMFPRKYNFFIVNDGIDRHASMLRPGQHGSAPAPSSAPSMTQPRRISLSTPTAATGPQQPQTPDQHGNYSRRRKISQVLDEPSASAGQNVSTSVSDTRAVESKPVGEQLMNGQELPQRRGQGHAASKDAQGDAGMADLEKSMSALRFVPPSVSRRFRERGEKAGGVQE